MEDFERREESKVEMRGVRSEAQRETSCASCRNSRASFGFLSCEFFDKPTSGAVNGCPAFER